MLQFASLAFTLSVFSFVSWRCLSIQLVHLWRRHRHSSDSVMPSLLLQVQQKRNDVGRIVPHSANLSASRFLIASLLDFSERKVGTGRKCQTHVRHDPKVTCLLHLVVLLLCRHEEATGLHSALCLHLSRQVSLPFRLFRGSRLLRSVIVAVRAKGVKLGY